MAGTPEEDLLAWLEREEERLGFTAVAVGLSDIESARNLFYEELGYDMVDGQFEGLREAMVTKYEEFPSLGISFSRREYPGGFQSVYRDKATGRFIALADVQSLLETIRGG